MKRNKDTLFLLFSVLMLLSTGIPFIIYITKNGWNGLAWLFLPAVIFSIALIVFGVFVQDRMFSGQFMGEAVQELASTSLRRLSVPVVLTEENGRIFWYNEKFRSQFLQVRRKSVTFQELLCMNVNTLMDGHDLMLEYHGKKYRVHSETIHMNELKKFYAVGN